MLFFKKKKQNTPEEIPTPTVPRSLPPLKILAISDLHTCFQEDMKALNRIMEKENPECICLLGDIAKTDLKILAKKALERDIPCLSVLGNHDYWGDNDGIRGLTNLDGKTADIHGVVIAGISGAPRYKPGPYAMRTEEEIEAVAGLLPSCDILISHESPLNLLSTNRSHSGFQAISSYIKRANPAIHIFGHHHWQYDDIADGTAEVCVYKAAILETDPYSIRHVFS